LAQSKDLFICAKDLFVEAKTPAGPAAFESDARNTRPTAVGAGLKMSASSMSDDFDGLDATEKAAVEAGLNNAKRPSDDVVQAAPVKCRYTKSDICANIAGFCLCRQANFDLPSSHDAKTRKTAARLRLTGRR
jgi:hypothetical protein